MKTKNLKLQAVLFTLTLFLVSFSACDKKKESTQSQATTTPIASEVKTDPLPSWNEGALKQAIIDYVTKVTKEGSADFIPVENRIATFDNDGTLWPEEPMVQGEYAIYRASKMVGEKPELAKKQPFKAIVEKDKAYFEKGGLKAVAELIIMTMSNMTEEEFEKDVNDFFNNMKYPKYNLTVANIAYKPQTELLQYLRDNGFKTYICSGGDIDFVRVVAPVIYGIPKDQVIGSSVKYAFIDSTRQLQRKPELFFMNDQATKPVSIQLHIGQRPVFACGNEKSGGDIEMLKYSQGNKYPSFQLLVNHNDSIREFAYSEPDGASLKAAADNNWHVVDMQKDWKEVFGK